MTTNDKSSHSTHTWPHAGDPIAVLHDDDERGAYGVSLSCPGYAMPGRVGYSIQFKREHIPVIKELLAELHKIEPAEVTT